MSCSARFSPHYLVDSNRSPCVSLLRVEGGCPFKKEEPSLLRCSILANLYRRKILLRPKKSYVNQPEPISSQSRQRSGKLLESGCEFYLNSMIHHDLVSKKQAEPFNQHQLCFIAFLIKLQLQRYRDAKGRDGGELHDILFGQSESGEDDLGAPSSPHSNVPTNEVSPSQSFNLYIILILLHSSDIRQTRTSMA